MGFQMCPQIACLREYKNTLVTFIWPFSTMDYSNVPTNCLTVRIQSHLGCIYVAFLHYRCSNMPLNFLHARIVNHISYIYVAFPTIGFQMSLQIANLGGYFITLVVAPIYQ